MPATFDMELDSHLDKLDKKKEDRLEDSKVIYFCTEFNSQYQTFVDQDHNLNAITRRTVITNLIQVVCALSENASFYHADLKTDNFLCTKDGAVKMFDFDFSGILDGNPCNCTPVDNDQVHNFDWGIGSSTRFNDTDGSPYLDKDGNKLPPEPKDREFLMFFDLHRVLLSCVNHISLHRLETIIDASVLNDELKKKLKTSIKRGSVLKRMYPFNDEPMVVALAVYEETLGGGIRGDKLKRGLRKPKRKGRRRTKLLNT